MKAAYRAKMMELVRAVRRHARGVAGDGSRGWAAIAEFWDDDGIWDVIVYRGAKTPAEAIVALADAAAKLDSR